MPKPTAEYLERRTALESALSAGLCEAGLTPSEAVWDRACDVAVREAVSSGLLSEPATRRAVDFDAVADPAIRLRDIGAAFLESRNPGE